MDKEVELILSKLKIVSEEQERGMYLCDKEHSKLLLDYITNLQQENEDNMKCIKSIKEQLESVINENQRLLNKWFENNDKMVELIGEKEVYNESLKEYKSRIEKAVEYIEHNTFQDSEGGWTFTFYKGKEILLDILNGRSDE